MIALIDLYQKELFKVNGFAAIRVFTYRKPKLEPVVQEFTLKVTPEIHAKIRLQ